MKSEIGGLVYYLFLDKTKQKSLDKNTRMAYQRKLSFLINKKEEPITNLLEPGIYENGVLQENPARDLEFEEFLTKFYKRRGFR